MRLPFLNRRNERDRLTSAFESSSGTLCCLYGRRRCGKSRLLLEALPKGLSAYYVADLRNEELQRDDCARIIAEVVPGFGQVRYPSWKALFEQWFRYAPEQSVLAIDEFPALVVANRELPSIMQKFVDRLDERRIHLVLCGSSQRMMQGLVLDGQAPLYGRAREILRLAPLLPGYLMQAFPRVRGLAALRHYSVWGGIPRYWELANEHASLEQGIEKLILDPLGVLHDEPTRLLLDDARDAAQTHSILSLIGRGCHRVSELSSRLARPASSLSRPLRKLVELGLVSRLVPFGTGHRHGGKSIYTLEDPFLRFWYRFVESNRSTLEGGGVTAVQKIVERDFDSHVAAVWESLARSSVSHGVLGMGDWHVARSWWGGGRDRRPLEIDLIASSLEGDVLLVGEVKLSLHEGEVDAELGRLNTKARRCKAIGESQRILTRLFVADYRGSSRAEVINLEQVFGALI